MGQLLHMGFGHSLLLRSAHSLCLTPLPFHHSLHLFKPIPRDQGYVLSPPSSFIFHISRLIHVTSLWQPDVIVHSPLHAMVSVGPPPSLHAHRGPWLWLVFLCGAWHKLGCSVKTRYCQTEAVHGSRGKRTGVANFMNGRWEKQGGTNTAIQCKDMWTIESWTSPLWVSYSPITLYMWILNMQLGRLKSGCISHDEYTFSKRNQLEL